MFLSYSPRYISVLHYSLLKPPTQIYPPNKYIPLTSSLSFTNKSFRRIPWASWHQIYQCPFISRNSSILSSWCLRLITLPVFWIPPLPVSQALLLLLYFQLLPLQLRIGKSMSPPSNKQKQPKSLPDPVLATSYCPPRSPPQISNLILYILFSTFMALSIFMFQFMISKRNFFLLVTSNKNERISNFGHC